MCWDAGAGYNNLSDRILPNLLSLFSFISSAMLLPELALAPVDGWEVRAASPVPAEHTVLAARRYIPHDSSHNLLPFKQTVII